MIGLELTCLAIVVLYVVMRARPEPRRRDFLLHYITLVAASWIGEDTMIRFHGFYAYSRNWSLFIDQVPILVSLIWPVVILSARDLALELSPQKNLVPWIAGAIVFADALLIEPIAVHAQLWSWVPGSWFGIPMVGILGWAFFAVAAAWVLEGRPLAWMLVIAPAIAHLGCIATWWLVFRWYDGAIPISAIVAMAWLLCAAAALTALRLHPRVSTRTLMLRGPGAAFFFLLLAQGEPSMALVDYALAFTVPYAVLLARQWQAWRMVSNTGTVHSSVPSTNMQGLAASASPPHGGTASPGIQPPVPEHSSQE